MKALITKTLAWMAAAAGLLIADAQPAQAQYWEATSQLSNLITPALSGSGRYKGLIEVSGLAGLGGSKINHVEISTSQGYQYADWFYMGAGIGVDIVHAPHTDDLVVDLPPGYSSGYPSGYPSYKYGMKSNGVMLPIFTDFRFDFPAGRNSGAASMYIDLRLGATWLLGNRYLLTDDGYLTNNSNFYLRPSIGTRIPLSKSNPRQAVSVGLSYLLITSDNNYWFSANNSTFNSLGASISFEW